MLVVCHRYKRESAELSHWLQEALERLEFWNTQTVAGPQELETVKDQLSAFLVSQAVLMLRNHKHGMLMHLVNQFHQKNHTVAHRMLMI